MSPTRGSRKNQIILIMGQIICPIIGVDKESCVPCAMRMGAVWWGVKAA
jgi:hypothetical protein